MERNKSVKREVSVAALQMECGGDREQNIETAVRLVREAAGRGAQIILLPELFETRYFCQEKDSAYYKLATTVEDNPAIRRLRGVACELAVVIVASFYELDGTVLYNSAAVIDADGTVLGVYRKTHIPDDQLYQEKYYFTPGDTGFRVWDTRYARIGVGICWDQWFPEAARAMALMGAELLLYPTAIGSEPDDSYDTMEQWRRVMQGHAAADFIPVAAANRTGTETVAPTAANLGQSSSITFYGSSFITDETGAIVEALDRTARNSYIVHTFDLENIADTRMGFGVYRDRRPEMYRCLTE